MNGLKKAIDKVFEEIDEQIELEMSECKSWWQAKMLSQKIKGKLTGCLICQHSNHSKEEMI